MESASSSNQLRCHQGLVRKLKEAASLAGCLFLLTVETVSAFEVGQTDWEFIDPDRSDRAVPTSVFYPAETAGIDVPVAEGDFPTVSFGHGFLIGADRYTYLAEALAEAGFIVALARTEGGLFPSHGALGLDLAFVLRALEAEGASESSLFFGHVAGPRAVLGHSMGGGASFLAADSDPSIDAVCNLAAAETNPSAIEAASRLAIPALLLAGSEDCVTPPSQHQIPMYEALASDCRTLVTVIGASHCQFAQSGSVCELGELGCGTPDLTREQQQLVVLELVVPWLEAQLNSDTDAWTTFQSRLQLGDTESIQDCEVSSSETPSPMVRDLQIRPNPLPSSGNLVLDWSHSLRHADGIEILDVAGRLRGRRSWNPSASGEIRWNLEGLELPAGSYWVVVRAEGVPIGRASLRVIR